MGARVERVQKADHGPCRGRCCPHETGGGKGVSPLQGVLLACYMNESMGLGRLSPAALETMESLGWRIARVQLPRFASWHVAEQTRLIAHLKHFWGGYAAVPRTMVDLGCHAGHGRHKNISDALLWLEEFPGPGLVVGVDAFEDFAFDLQYRFDQVEPYASSPATKRTFALGIGPADNTVGDMTGLARQHIMCCSNTGWCQDMHTQLEARGSDHMCKLVRMRLGILPPDGRLTHRPSRYTSNLTLTLWKNLGQWKKSDPRTKNLYMVPIMRVDTFWSVHLQERHIDFLKIDMDMSWRRMGLEKLVEAQGFTVMVIEVDVSWVPPWGAKRGVRGGVDLIWNLTEADLFAFYASSRGYDVFFKVPCTMRDHSGSFVGLSAWYFLVANASWFAATGYWVRKRHADPSFGGMAVQDLLLVRRSAHGLAASLTAQGMEDCRQDLRRTQG